MSQKGRTSEDGSRMGNYAVNTAPKVTVEIAKKGGLLQQTLLNTYLNAYTDKLSLHGKIHLDQAYLQHLAAEAQFNPLETYLTLR